MRSSSRFDLLRQLNGPLSTLPPYVTVLPPLKLPPPAEFAQLCGLVHSCDADECCAFALDMHAQNTSNHHHIVPSTAKPIRHPQLAAFVTNLFVHIQSCSPVANVNLSVWDLFHAHLFKFGGIDAPGEQLPASVGFVFHAKEHPKEFSLSQGVIHPIGSQFSGGANDPRIGTQLSIFDADFAQRNYVWLLSNPQHIFLVDVSHAACPRQDLVQTGAGRFHTLDASSLSSIRGDVLTAYLVEGALHAVPHRSRLPEHAFCRCCPTGCAARANEDLVHTLNDMCDDDIEELNTLVLFPQKFVNRSLCLRSVSPANELAPAIARELDARKQKRENQLEAALLRLRRECVGVKDNSLREALQLTQANVFRAHSLLRVACSQARAVPPLRREYPTVDFPLEVGHRVLYGLDATGTSVDDAIEVLLRVQGSEINSPSDWQRNESWKSAVEEEICCIRAKKKAEFEQTCSDNLDAAIAKFNQAQEQARVGGADQHSSCTAAAAQTHEQTVQTSKQQRRRRRRKQRNTKRPVEPQQHQQTTVQEAPTQPPRCCESHQLVHRIRNGGTQIAVADRTEGMRQWELGHSPQSAKSWFVLIGGETWSIMRPDPKGTRPGKFLAGHCSLQNIGLAYATIVDVVGRDQIIVVVQLQETLDWLREATKSDEDCVRVAGNAKLMPMLKRRLLEIERDCAQLIADGGADYDHERVNPATVLHVLTGSPEIEGDRVVPRHGVRAVTVVINSHGNAHHTHTGSRHREHYCHFPYHSADRHKHLYDPVSYRGYDTDMEESNTDNTTTSDNRSNVQNVNTTARSYPPKFMHLMYGTMLFRAYHEMLMHAPFRKVVLLYQFCLSGGAANFLERSAFHNYFGTNKWPIYLMVTAGPDEPALGKFLSLWFENFKHRLSTCPTSTLDELFADVELQYWDAYPEVARENQRVQNELRARAAGHPTELLPETEISTMGNIGRFAGEFVEPGNDDPSASTTWVAKSMANALITDLVNESRAQLTSKV